MTMPTSYYSIRVPYVSDAAGRTEWHPTEPDGPFKVLSRGSFATHDDAVAWGRAKLNGTPYTVVLVSLDGLAELPAASGE